jgi:hypothetical protein
LFPGDGGVEERQWQAGVHTISKLGRYIKGNNETITTHFLPEWNGNSVLIVSLLPKIGVVMEVLDI